MPLFERESVGVVGVVLVLAVAWIGISTGSLPLGPIFANASVLAGVGILIALGYFAYDVVEDGDSASDVIGKTADRTEDATGGLLEGASALILGTLAILMTVGTSILDLLASVVDLGASAPLVVTNVLTGLVGGFAGFLGLSPTMVIGIAAILLFGGLVARRRS